MSAPSETLRGIIIEWNEARGFGFIDDGRRRLFLHRREFRQHHRTPAHGDLVTFHIGADAQGRVCATQAELMNDGGRIRAGDLFLLGVLLVAPGIALYRLSHVFPIGWPVGVTLIMSAITYAFYSSDKQRARDKAWRVTEVTLHLCELLGGWPGAFVAQRRLRHKVSKLSYQVVFWLIVAAYQYVAIDSLLDWQLARRARTLVSSTASARR